MTRRSRHVEFIEYVERNFSKLQVAAIRAREAVETIVRDAGIPFHLVEGRVKSIESLRDKLIRKDYENPRREVTDIIGVRVITFFPDHVDKVVGALKEAVKVVGKFSTDKRSSLGLRQFGYRSVHLIVCLPPSRARSPEFAKLGSKRFEVQVRSILEHAWAEIEHGVVYKSGIEYFDKDLRNFSALAGALEILDNQFLSLRERKHEIIGSHIETYKQGLELGRRVDVARLESLMRWKFPDGRKFREGEGGVCVRALKAIRLSTAKEILKALRTKGLASRVKAYAVTAGILPVQVSHLAIVILLTTLRNRKILREHFPSVLMDPGIARYALKD